MSIEDELNIGDAIHDGSILIAARGWLRYRTLSWLLKDTPKFKVVRPKKVK